MNKYELALVVSAKIEDDARTAQQKSSRTFVSWTMFFVSYALEKTRHSIRK